MFADDSLPIGGRVLLGERSASIALGLVGRFRRPLISHGQVAREDSCDLAEPDDAKTIYELASVS